jgi:nucleoside-diphosphate-sugar epimerase
VVDGDPSDDSALDYARAKRGSELAVLEFMSSALVARAGLILGPYEDVGRLPWWLRRIERGGRVLAPGPRDRPLQYIDARDLATWMLAAARRQLSGVFNTVSPPGHTTTGRLLDLCCQVTGSDAQLVWVSPEQVEAAGIAPWTEMPIWVPPTGEYAGLHNGNVKAALREGLRCRPTEETVADTWAWLQAEGDPTPRADLQGLSPAREAAALAAADREAGSR